jgi:DNA modification methylase
VSWRVVHGSCLEVLATMAPDSIHAIVTDGPYGIGFMGREWDTFKPDEAEARIVPNRAIGSDNPNLKGRARGPASSPSAIEYDSSIDGMRRFQAFTATWAAEAFRVLKPGGYILSCGAPRSYHRMACGLEDGGFVIRDKFAWLFGSGFPKSLNLGDGKGTALKPGHEPIAVAWKPFKGTISACHAAHGTAALYVDACRIGTESTKRLKTGGPGQFPHEDDAWDPRTVEVGSDCGRWPANVLLDEEAAAMLDEQSGELSGRVGMIQHASGTNRVYGTFARTEQSTGHSGTVDTGGASRFFYVAKPSREERDLGTHHLAARQRDDSRDATAPGANNPRNRGGQLRGNFHPTVKPIALMRWLIRLVTPPGGTVLDPFTGSGTTGMAARLEQRPFIGIEREAEYVELAEARIHAIAPLFSEMQNP